MTSVSECVRNAWRAPFERAAQLLVIVNLPLKTTATLLASLKTGWWPPGRSNDAEAAHSQRRGGSEEQSVFVRAAMPKRLHHPARKASA